MVIDMESLYKLLKTLFPGPKYSISCYQGDYGFSLVVYIDTCEVFSIEFYKTPMLVFSRPLKYAEEYATLNSIFDLNQVGLYSYDIKRFKNDSK